MQHIFEENITKPNNKSLISTRIQNTLYRSFMKAHIGALVLKYTRFRTKRALQKYFDSITPLGTEIPKYTRILKMYKDIIVNHNIAKVYIKML